MKGLKHKLTSTLALLLFLSAAQIASAFYDPSLGRWLSRDPAAELGFQEIVVQTGRGNLADNLHCFLHNSAINEIDPFGLYKFADSCSRVQRDKMRIAIALNCRNAKNCCTGNAAATTAVGKMCDPNDPKPVINCPDEATPMPDGVYCTDRRCGRGYTEGEQIFICPNSFRDDQQNRFGCPLDCTLFHEGLHTQGLLHGSAMTAFDNCMGCTPQSPQ